MWVVFNTFVLYVPPVCVWFTDNSLEEIFVIYIFKDFFNSISNIKQINIVQILGSGVRWCRARDLFGMQVLLTKRGLWSVSLLHAMELPIVLWLTGLVIRSWFDFTPHFKSCIKSRTRLDTTVIQEILCKRNFEKTSRITV